MREPGAPLTLTLPQHALEQYLTILKETESSSSSDQKPEDQEEMSGLMSVLTSVMSMGGKDELSLTEFLDSAMSYAKGDVPQMVMVLNKGEIEEYNKASAIEKVCLQLA